MLDRRTGEFIIVKERCVWTRGCEISENILPPVGLVIRVRADGRKRRDRGVQVAVSPEAVNAGAVRLDQPQAPVGQRRQLEPHHGNPRRSLLSGEQQPAPNAGATCAPA